MEMEKKEKTAVAEKRGDLVVRFKRPYVFEGECYDEVDLSGLEDMTIQDAVDVQGQLSDGTEVAAMMVTELSHAFARALAARAAGKPIEFFQLLPMGAAKKVTNAVRGFLNGAAAEQHVVKLERPYHFAGREYTEVDLSGVEELTSMHISRAENQLVRAGFVVTENSFNYLYACIVAGMAAQLPTEFFTGLPLAELLKIKNAVNDASFFE